MTIYPAMFLPRSKYKVLIIILLLFVSATSFAQTHRLKFGTQIPISFALGYEYQFKNKLTGGLQVGVLTSPYTEFFTSMMRNWGMSVEMKNILEEATTYAIVVQPSVGYTFNEKYHIELFGQHVFGPATTPPITSFLSFFGTTAEEYQDLIDLIPLETELEISARLYYVGLQIERRFQLKNPKWEFRLGVGFTSNIRTRNTLKIEQRGSVQLGQDVIDDITLQVNEEIRDTYLKYAHIPVVNVMFVRKLGK